MDFSHQGLDYFREIPYLTDNHLNFFMKILDVIGYISR
jgi:hypothetical protein